MRSGYTAADPESTHAGAAGEATACPVCTTEMRPSFQDDEAVYKLCPRCTYLKPCLRDLDAYAVNVEIYRERYDEQLKTAAVVSDKARRKYGRFLDEVEPYRENGRLLDIGCGAGRLLACAAEKLSAERFAEYLSLGEVPVRDESGAPPIKEVQWVAPKNDVQLVFTSFVQEDPPAVEELGDGTLRAPHFPVDEEMRAHRL